MRRIAFSVPKEEWRNPCFELAQAFDPSADVVYEITADADWQITIGVADGCLSMAALSHDGYTLESTDDLPLSDFPKEAFKKKLYLFMAKLFGKTLPWGVLTGIKPVKLTHEMIKYEGMSGDESADALVQRYAVSPKKAALAADLAVQEIPVVYPEGGFKSDKKRISVYLGVPICPAKCSYCSFVSTVADKKGRLAEEYLHNLCIEIEYMSRLVQEKDLKVDTLYIGGGTPSVFSAEQMETLLSALEGTFIHPGLREFTFEAGRPETTTPDKLRVMKVHHVDRVCLNPQSMNADTLQAINRRHTPEDIIRVYDDIRAIGFDCVNMDLIVGLASEPPEAFLHSLDEVIRLAPENLTVHSLAIKHGSAIHEAQGHALEQLYNDTFYRRIEERLSVADYHPYYLYRQKYTQGSGENVGYCKPGYLGIYNILMMAERQSILGIGAGSSGKVYDPELDRFYKVFTVKDIRTYNQRINETIERKMKDYEAL